MKQTVYAICYNNRKFDFDALVNAVECGMVWKKKPTKKQIKDSQFDENEETLVKFEIKASQ